MLGSLSLVTKFRKRFATNRRRDKRRVCGSIMTNGTKLLRYDSITRELFIPSLLCFCVVAHYRVGLLLYANTVLVRTPVMAPRITHLGAFGTGLYC